MAAKSRRQYKGGAVANTLAATLAVNGTSITVVQNMSTGGWPTGSEPFFCVIDPGTTKEEKVCVIYASTTTLTVVDPASTSGWSASVNGRAADNTTDRQHDAGAVIYPCFTAYEADQANELVSKYAHQGAIVHQGASTFTELQIGTAGQVLKVNSGATAPEWGQVPTAGITDLAVTTAKIADSNVTTAKIADNNVTLAKLAAAVQAAINPTGTIHIYGGSSAPTGYLLCDGSTFSSSTYPELATILGDNYGTHSGTTYYLPNLNGKVPVGKDAGQTEFDVLGETGGAKTVTLDTTMIPSHTHSATLTITNAGSHNHTYYRTSSGTVAAGGSGVSGVTNETLQNTSTVPDHTHGSTLTINNTGGGSAHNNLQPYIVVNYIIKT